MENELTMTPESMATASISKPRIYSKKAVLYFSFFCSPIFGGALVLINLWTIGKKSVGFAVLFLSIIYSYLIGFLSQGLLYLISYVAHFIFNVSWRYFLTSQLPTFIFNLVGAYILTEFVQGKFFPNEEEFEIKEIWIPLSIAVGLFLLGIAFLFFYRFLLYSH